MAERYVVGSWAVFVRFPVERGTLGRLTGDCSVAQSQVAAATAALGSYGLRRLKPEVRTLKEASDSTSSQ